MKKLFLALVLALIGAASSFADDKPCSIWTVSEDATSEIPSEAHALPNVPAGCFDGRIVFTQTGLSACRVDLSQYGIPSDRYGRYFVGKGCKQLSFNRVANEPQKPAGPNVSATNSSVYTGRVKKVDPDHPNGSPFKAPGASSAPAADVKGAK